MATRFIKSIAAICHVQVEELKINGLYEFEAQERLVDDFILPKALGVGGSEKRFPHISDEFMSFMAEFGQECITRDRRTGEVLMELAMQRISCGAIATEEYDFIGSLPPEYQRYTAVYDEAALMSQACWDFIERNIQFCVEGLENKTWRKHAISILWSLVENINENGTTASHYVWNEGLVATPLKGVFSWAMYLAGREFNPYEVACHLAHSWRGKKNYFREHLVDVINMTSKEVRKAFEDVPPVGIYGNRYFKVGTERLLKIFGIYERVLLAYVLKDIRS